MTATATRKAPRKATAKKKNFTPKSAEQKEAEAKAAHDRLVAQTEVLMTESGWTNYLRAGKYLFGKYSLNNCLLILAQRPNASVVGAFGFWIEKGRCPIKGQGIQIRKFVEIEEVDERTGDTSTLQRFPLFHVWDIEDTRIVDEEKWAKWSAKMDLPTGPVARPTGGSSPVLLTGEDPTGLGDRVADYLRGKGWSVIEKTMKRPNGYASPADREVAVRDDVEPAQRAKTLVHEAGHIELGHTDDMAEYGMHRGRMECEAESVAYVVADSEGLDTMAYSAPYLGSWAEGDAAMVKQTAEKVLKAARAIMQGIEVTDEEEDGEEG